MNDTNWFTVLMKAFVENFDGNPPTKDQWQMLTQILKDIPTERLSK